VERRRESTKMVAGQFSMIRQSTEVLRRRTMWRGCIDKKTRWWCVTSWDEIWIVHWSMRNDLKVVDEVYIKRVLLALEDFLFFSLYSFSYIAKQFTTLKQLRLLCGLVLISSKRISSFSPRSCYRIVLSILPTLDPTHYTRTSLYNIVPDTQCAYIARQGVSIVPNLALCPVGST
jgi:hypothetical protein